jgi:hypothetical protein
MKAFTLCVMSPDFRAERSTTAKQRQPSTESPDGLRPDGKCWRAKKSALIFVGFAG